MAVTADPDVLEDTAEDTAEEAAFRAQARAWLLENASTFAGGDTFSFDSDAQARAKAWQAKLFDSGWAGITWPKEYGGRGGSVREAQIFGEEAARFDVPANAFAVGVGMAGPTILAHGTDEQKARFLPPMLRGDEVWCQLFSEPGAGSDLANLSCRAARDGDEWVVDGQKVWTSGAQHSDFGILLTRTDVDQPKHRGITYFLIDMRQPGIEVRPLRQITGASHFNEVFLTAARVPDANRLAELNGGWGVAMTTLSFERNLIGGMGGGGGAGGIDSLVTLARGAGVASSAVVRQGLAAAYARGETLRFLALRKDPMLGNLMKLAHGWNLKLTSDLALAIEGASGMLIGEDAPSRGSWQQSFLSAPSIRIAGGSDEVQRNIIGERILGLPPEPRVDKTLPFKDTLRLA